MGATVEIFDFDEVDIVNVGTQLYGRSDLGKPKVEALSALVNDHSADGLVTGHEMQLSKDTDPSLLDCNVLISCLDSIAIRQELWPVIKEGAWDHFIDMRMAAEFLTLYTVSTQDDMVKYEAQLLAIDPEDIPEISCTMKATYYTASFAAGWAAVIVRRLLSEMTVPFVMSHDIMEVKIKVN